MKREIFLVFILIISFSFVFASEVEDEEYLLSVSCLLDSKEILLNMQESGFNIKRVNDTLNQANNMFEAQKALDDRGRGHNYSFVIEFCNQIKTMSLDAFSSRDELLALEQFYSESLEESLNTSSVDNLINQIKSEIESERYEKVSALVDIAYEEIINIKSEQTALNLAYETTKRNLKDFLINNWKYILIVLFSSIVILLISKNAISQGLIRHKIKRLEYRKETIKSLIQKTQRDYFEKGIVSESTYMIRIKKFAELIRDIDRQIPLLKEQLIKIMKKKESDEVFKKNEKKKRVSKK